MRMKHLHFLYGLGLILTLFSCEKEEFKGDPGVPVFTADIPFLDAENFEVVAGDDLFYMFASHQELDSSTVYSGLFGKEDICEEGCAENFAIKIVEKHSASMSSTPFAPGKYEYFSIPKDGYKHSFSVASDQEDVLNATRWRLGNLDHAGPNFSVNSDNDSAPQETMEMLYDVQGQFIARFERPIVPRTVDCSLELKIERVIGEGIYLVVDTESPFAFVSWSTGSIGNRLLVNFDTQTYTANIFDGSGCQTKLIVFFKSPNITEDYSVTLNQTSTVFTTPDNADRAVIIEYTAPDGTFYTSSIIGQILPFEFSIIEAEEYQVNELGDPTWKIESKFNCILFGENGETKRIVDGQATFAVSY